MPGETLLPSLRRAGVQPSRRERRVGEVLVDDAVVVRAPVRGKGLGNAAGPLPTGRQPEVGEREVDVLLKPWAGGARDGSKGMRALVQA